MGPFDDSLILSQSVSRNRPKDPTLVVIVISFILAFALPIVYPMY